MAGDSGVTAGRADSAGGAVGGGLGTVIGLLASCGCPADGFESAGFRWIDEDASAEIGPRLDSLGSEAVPVGGAVSASCFFW